MFAVIIDPIRRDRHARDGSCLRGPCMGERIPATRWRAGMLRDVSDTQEQLKRRGEGGEPKQKWRPAPDEQRYRQQDYLHEQKPPHCARGRLCALDIGDRCVKLGPVLHIERAPSIGVGFAVAAFGG